MLVALLPARNEEASIARVVSKVRQQVDVTLVVDDASEDGTGLIAASLGCVLLRNERHAGYGATLRRGLLWCQHVGASGIVTLDSDGQHAADWIERCTPLLSEGVDVVFGNRFATVEGVPQTKILSNNLAWHCLKKIIGRSPVCEDVSCGFRMYNQQGLNSAINASIDARGYAFTHATCVDLHLSGLSLAAILVPAIYSEPVIGTQIDEVRDFLTWLSRYSSMGKEAKGWLVNLDRNLPMTFEIESWRTGEMLRVAGEQVGGFLHFTVVPSR